jgi:hypothetical protein
MSPSPILVPLLHIDRLVLIACNRHRDEQPCPSRIEVDSMSRRLPIPCLSPSRRVQKRLYCSREDEVHTSSVSGWSTQPVDPRHLASRLKTGVRCLSSSSHRTVMLIPYQGQPNESTPDTLPLAPQARSNVRSHHRDKQTCSPCTYRDRLSQSTPIPGL